MRTVLLVKVALCTEKGFKGDLVAKAKTLQAPGNPRHARLVRCIARLDLEALPLKLCNKHCRQCLLRRITCHAEAAPGQQENKQQASERTRSLRSEALQQSPV